MKRKSIYEKVSSLFELDPEKVEDRIKKNPEDSLEDLNVEDKDKNVLADKEKKDITTPQSPTKPIDTEEDKAIYIVKYRRLYKSPSGNLVVVRRIGWDSRAGMAPNTDRFYVIHVPTRSDLGFVFDKESDARNFVNEIDRESNWGFTDFSKSKVNVEAIYRLAGKRYGLNVLGHRIA